MTTYRIAFAYTEQGIVDIDAVGPEEAKESFWLTFAGQPCYVNGDMTTVEVTKVVKS